MHYSLTWMITRGVAATRPAPMMSSSGRRLISSSSALAFASNKKAFRSPHSQHHPQCIQKTFISTTTSVPPRRFMTTSSPSSSSSGGGGGRVSSATQDANLLSKTSTFIDDSTTSTTTTPISSPPASSALDTNPVKGTRDFYPDDMRLRTWLFAQWRIVAKQFGFQEYDAPVLESEALYIRKAGEEVVQQLYNFVDKGERAVALRPEMTPSLARMVLAKQAGLSFPLKWYAIPQCWRYERMTRGRRREHYQWNMDIWGIPGVQAEAELLAAMITLFQNVGLTQADVGIKVNSRLVLAEVLTSLNIPSSKFAATCVLVDKLEKVPMDAIQGDLEQLGLDQQVVETLLQVLSSKSLEALTELLGPDSAAIQQLQEMLQLCDAYGMREWIVLDASVVRGLAYYTGIVFEAFDRQGQLRAIAGGGRYDTLLQTFGANEPCPAAGFGFGDAVIVELLQDRKLLPTFEQLAAGSVDSVVYAMTPTLYPVAIQVAGMLRQAGQSVDVVLDPTKKTKWVFKHADRLQANYCVLVAPEEYERKEISIKNLMTGQQITLAMEALSEWARTSSSSSSSSGITNSGKGSGSSGSHEE